MPQLAGFIHFNLPPGTLTQTALAHGIEDIDEEKIFNEIEDAKLSKVVDLKEKIVEKPKG